ncbi:MAG: hypothetical protein NT069_12535, partial [Planctomycetota bacterium]|nr:hypothetical protein [Planctomycetota bacterium]
DALAKRLVARVDVVSFSGKLPTVPVKFRVLDADANADKQPRVVLGPGEYPLPSASARRGDATLKIVGRPVGDRRTNDAQLIFEATEFTGVLPPDSHKLEIPDGWGTWAIVCRPTDGFLFLLHKGSVRKIDYSKPRNVTDTPVNDLPAEFRDEVKRQLEIHEISSEQQAEIFEKPAAPATTPAPKTSATEHGKKAGAEVRPPVDDELVFITRDASLPAKLDVGDRVTVAIRQEAHYGAGIVASIRYTAADGAVSGHDVDMATSSTVSGCGFSARTSPTRAVS